MPSPLLGYNTNVRHRGKIFHIQTEDSGVAHAHIFTHLFADGGRIIATKKTTYAKYMGTERFPGVVKKLMQAQHKAMFIALRDGLFDEDEVAGAKSFAEREIVLEEDATQPTQAAGHPRKEVDVAALERAAAAISSSGIAAPAVAAPAPPLVAKPAPKATPPAALRPASVAPPAPPRPVPPPARPLSTPRSVAPPAAPARPRYQTTQPAAVKARAPKPNESLFGADILSEKSLDEVIMSYLADDLDEKD